MKRSSIICKIIEEISQYLMKKGYFDIDISIRQTEKDSVIVISTDKIDDELLSEIMSRLKVKRRLEMEEYCWELMGEGIASQQDLNLVGLSTDEVEIEEKDNKTIMRLTRYE